MSCNPITVVKRIAKKVFVTYFNFDCRFEDSFVVFIGEPIVMGSNVVIGDLYDN